MKALYPGSFDPVTYGHLDVIRRAADVFDELIVSVLNNKAKTPLFSVDERVKILREATKDIPNIRVASFSGLLTDYAKSIDVHVAVRGLRAITGLDTDYGFVDKFGLKVTRIKQYKTNQHVFIMKK